MAKRKLDVLIADDEELICVLLQKIILWDELNLNFIGFAHDGDELFRVIKDKKPDIVITDICMPLMDGIELIAQVRQEKIECRFIIVSGYRQFEYAHNALKYDVDDYILKPVDTEELNGALKRISYQLSGEKAEKEQAALLTAKDNEKRMKRLFMKRIIYDLTPENSDLSDLEREYGITFQKGLFQVIHVKSDIAGNENEYLDNINSVQQKLISVFENIFQPDCCCIIVDADYDILRFGINYPFSKKDKINSNVQTYFEHVENIIDLFKDYKVTIGVGKAYPDIWQLKISDEEAQYAVYSRLVRGNDRIIYWNTEVREEKSSILSLKEEQDFLHQLKSVYEIIDPDGFKKLMAGLFVKIRLSFSSADMCRFLNLIIDTFFEEKRQMIERYGDEDYLKKQLIFGMKRASNIKDMEQAVSETIGRALEKFNQEIESQNTRPVRLAVKYIKEHYSEAVKLEDVAGFIGLNTSYFSNVFKKTTGSNFVDYLTDYRMEKAKALLRESSLSIQEIAQKTGYLDTRYFSKLFKKTVGIKPSEYRRIYG